MYVTRCKPNFVEQNPSQYREITQIFLDGFRQSMRISQQKIKRRIKTGKYIVHLFMRDSKIAGFSYSTMLNRDVVHIDFFAIANWCKGGGTGTHALRLLQRCFKGKVITLECEDKLVNFYTKCGFVRAPYNYCLYPVKLNFMIKDRKGRFVDYSNVAADFNNIKLQHSCPRETESKMRIRMQEFHNHNDLEVYEFLSFHDNSGYNGG